MTFKNEAQMRKFLLGKCANAVSGAKEKVYVELEGNLNQFYVEFYPNEYERTGALFNSLDVSETVQTGNGARAKVYFNTPSYDTGSWSGGTVLEVALESGVPHGGYAGGTPVWTESMESLGNKSGIKSLLIQELKKQGL